MLLLLNLRVDVKIWPMAKVLIMVVCLFVCFFGEILTFSPTCHLTIFNKNTISIPYQGLIPILRWVTTRLLVSKGPREFQLLWNSFSYIFSDQVVMSILCYFTISAFLNILETFHYIYDIIMKSYWHRSNVFLETFFNLK